MDFSTRLTISPKVIFAIFGRAKNTVGRFLERENLSQNFHGRRRTAARRENIAVKKLFGSGLANGDNLKIDALVKMLPLYWLYTRTPVKLAPPPHHLKKLIFLEFCRFLIVSGFVIILRNSSDH